MTEAVVLNPLGSGTSRLMRRFSAPERHLAFWIALWAAVLLGALGSLAQFVLERESPVEPVQVVFRLVGLSFGACGLIAWRRRPDSHSGRLLTATGFALYVSPLLSLIDSPVAVTVSNLFPDLWVLPFVALVLTFLTGGPAADAGRPGPGRCRPRRARRPGTALRSVRRVRGGVAVRAARGRRRRDRHRAEGPVPAHLRGHRRGGLRALVGRVTAGQARHGPGRRRRRLPARLRRPAGGGPRRRRASDGAALGGGLHADHRPARVPRGPAAVATRPGRRRRPVPQAADDAARRAAGRAGEGAG